MEWLTKNWKSISQVASFALGVGITIHEVFIADKAEPQILGFAALCLGFVTAWRADELRKEKKSGNE